MYSIPRETEADKLREMVRVVVWMYIWETEVGRDRLIYHIWSRQRRLCAIGPDRMPLMRTDRTNKGGIRRRVLHLDTPTGRSDT